jgi:hypothetical protein
MKAVLKDIDLGSPVGFEEFVPKDPNDFSVWITASVGPAEAEGADLFQLEVCTPSYIRNELLAGGGVWGRHKLLVDRYDPELIRKIIADRVDHCDGSNWVEVAERVARFAHWEFEDYQP